MLKTLVSPQRTRNNSIFKRSKINTTFANIYIPTPRNLEEETRIQQSTSPISYHTFSFENELEQIDFLRDSTRKASFKYMFNKNLESHLQKMTSNSPTRKKSVKKNDTQTTRGPTPITPIEVFDNSCENEEKIERKMTMGINDLLRNNSLSIDNESESNSPRRLLHPIGLNKWITKRDTIEREKMKYPHITRKGGTPRATKNNIDPPIITSPFLVPKKLITPEPPAEKRIGSKTVFKRLKCVALIEDYEQDINTTEDKSPINNKWHPQQSTNRSLITPTIQSHRQNEKSIRNWEKKRGCIPLNQSFITLSNRIKRYNIDHTYINKTPKVNQTSFQGIIDLSKQFFHGEKISNSTGRTKSTTRFSPRGTKISTRINTKSNSRKQSNSYLRTKSKIIQQIAKTENKTTNDLSRNNHPGEPLTSLFGKNKMYLTNTNLNVTETARSAEIRNKILRETSDYAMMKTMNDQFLNNSNSKAVAQSLFQTLNNTRGRNNELKEAKSLDSQHYIKNHQIEEQRKRQNINQVLKVANNFNKSSVLAPKFCYDIRPFSYKTKS